MAVKELPLLVWRAFAEDRVVRSEGAVATQMILLTTTGVELIEDKHYWEAELLSKEVNTIFIGISRPNLGPRILGGREAVPMAGAC
jgi:hypothetical protein